MTDYAKIAKDRLVDAISEAERFLKAAKKLREVDAKDDWNHPIESGAAKRASMDLTRSLAVFRRSPYS